MKLGTETGSLVNHVMSNMSTVEEITIGMGATKLSWTDRTPVTVIEVFKKGKHSYIRVQADSYKRTDNNGLSDNQNYEYTRDPEGAKSTFRITEDGFQAVYLSASSGRYRNTDGGLFVGKRERYYDPSF